MYQFDQYRTLANDEKWQPTREDIHYLLQFIDYQEAHDSMAADRLQKIREIYDGIYSDVDPDSDAVVEMMAYQAQAGLTDLNDARKVQEKIDELLRKKHQLKNFVPGT